MSDSSDRANIPFLIILILAFIVAAIIFFGPEIQQALAGRIPGSRPGSTSIGNWDPFDSVMRGLQSLGDGIARLFMGFRR